MRRSIPIALLLATAGGVALVLRWHSNRAEPLAPELAAAPAHAAPSVDEPAVQADQDLQRAALTQLSEASATTADRSDARLTLHVIARSTRKPVAEVRLLLTPTTGAETARQHRNSSEPRGDLVTCPITGADGTAQFDLPPGREFSLRAVREDQAPGRRGTEVEHADGSTSRILVKFEQSLRLSTGDQSASADPRPVLIPALLAGERRELVLLIDEELEGHVVGKVVCAETHEPIAGARVRVLSGGQARTEWHTPGPDERTTGNDGLFELSFSLTSDPRLCVEAEGYGLRYASLDAVHADLAHAFVVYVSRAASLSVRVLDSAGAPIPDARVELRVNGNLLAHHEADEQGFYSSGISFSFPPDERWSAETGADGRARIVGLPPRVEIGCELMKAGRELRREPEGLTFEPGEQRAVEWRIGSGTVVRGLALDQDGKPVAELEIWAALSGSVGRRYFASYERSRLGARTRTDRDGRFALLDLAPGKWSIGAGAEDGGDVAPIAELVEIAGEPTLELTLRIYRGLYIRGRVLAPGGGPALHVWVNGFIPPADRPEGVETGKDGDFAFGPLGPGTVTLTADAVGRFGSSDPVQASAGDSGVVLQLKQGGRIRGRVVDGVTGATCTAQLVFAPEQHVAGMLENGMQTTTRPDGSFSEEGFEPGRWSVTASTADGRFAQQAHIEVGAASDSGELVLALAPGGKLRFGYKGSAPLIFVTVTRGGAAVLMQTGVEQGKFSEYMAPAGSLVLEIRKEWSGSKHTQALELKPGETKEVVLTDED